MSSENKEQKNEEAGTPVNVLIIAHKQSQFASAASFLSRRGIPCTVKSNIREGLQFITKSKATHVFLSWNLPGANIIKTYQLITKTFKVDCVVYAEKSDGKTAAELTMSRLPEVMQAPVSGPGLYMRIQKLIKQKEEGPADTAQEKRNNHQQQNKSKTIKLKCTNKDIPTDGTWESAGVDPEDGQPIYRFKSNQKSSMTKNSYTFKGPKPPTLGEDGTWGDGGGTFQMESEETESKPRFVNFQKKGALQTEENVQTEESDGDGSGNDLSELLDGIDISELESPMEGASLTDEMSIQTQDENSNELSSDSDDEESRSLNHESETADGSAFTAQTKKKRQEKSYGSVMNVAKKIDKKESATPEYQRTAPKEALILNKEPTLKSNDPISILAEKVLEAIKNSTKPSDSESIGKVETLTEAKAFTIHSPRFNGYLVLASSNKISLNEETFQNIKEHMMILLDKVGEKLLNLEELNLDLNNLEFQVWADEHAEFVISSTHEGNEIICAFIPTGSTLPKVKENADPSMISVGAKDLEAQTKAKFNLFLHLPKNNKFIRYLKPGDDIQTKHLEKFDEHKLDDLHIKKEDLKCFKEYYVANKLNNLPSQTKKKAS